MNTSKNKILILLLLTVVAVSCRKTNDPPIVYEAENPLPGFLSTSGFNQHQDEAIFMISDKEYGFSFTPTVKGKIIAILVNTPEPGDNLKVKIYDNATTSLILTELINITEANTETAKYLPVAFGLDKNREYTITLTTAKAIFRFRNDWGNITFPVTSGNILITGVASKPSPTSAFPTTNAYNGYLGDITFIFQRTE